MFYMINFSLLILLFKFSSESNYQFSHHENLRNRSKNMFFSIRSLDLVKDIDNFQQNCYFQLLTLSKMKNKHHSLFLIFVLLLSGNISTNPGPNQNRNINHSNNNRLPFQKSGIHITHLNVNSLLPKLDEIKDFILHTKPTVFGISESKLDNSISNSEIDINEYIIIRSDRNRHGGGKSCLLH